ncbi:hypothetical protein [Bradyrhizobium sp. MOS002]|uniref:hypothetical protein n=1 Tax=Bradyrhizobium sp. MOS002 TaxID=2133947 RepID=UPI0027D2CEE1|nr:hypothetical protein [Bradyrhizobium sp. MOS002]
MVINNRGPFTRGVTLDLSRSAAGAISGCKERSGCACPARPGRRCWRSTSFAPELR